MMNRLATLSSKDLHDSLQEDMDTEEEEIQVVQDRENRSTDGSEVQVMTESLFNM